MTLTSAQRVRQRIQDPYQRANDTYYGDGTANSFSLPHANLQSATAFIGLGSPPTAWSATGATFDSTGFVEFSAVMSAQSAFNVRYVHSVFSDSVIDEYISGQGSVLGAALQCAYDLQFDNVKRSRWMAANGASWDNIQAGTYVKQIIDAIKEELTEEATQGGGFNSWAETQEEW